MRNHLKPNVIAKKVKGRTYYYFRIREGNKERHIKMPPPGPEHDAMYWSIKSGKHVQQVKTTFDALIESYLSSPGWQKKAKGTKRRERPILDRIRAKNGSKDVRLVRRKNVMEIHQRLAATTRQADYTVQMLRTLFKHAIHLEWITVNPAKDVELFGAQTAFEPWPEKLLLAFERIADGDTRLFYELCVSTGQRAGDVVKMEWDHFDGEYMAVLQEKTGARVWIYCPDRLLDLLEATPKTGKFILAKNLTEHITYNSIQKKVKAIRDLIRAQPEHSIHGWRYNAVVQLAEAGCSDSEIQSVTGHATLEMVQKYRAQASQKKLSKSAQRRRANRTETERE